MQAPVFFSSMSSLRNDLNTIHRVWGLGCLLFDLEVPDLLCCHLAVKMFNLIFSDSYNQLEWYWSSYHPHTFGNLV